MDYDDIDFQGQNLHLAGEGSKISPVLHPYAIPKFDFDDNLQGHLRFDSLVENEVFLGIPSQEDNQWINDFSRGSSGIEFSSSATESCSISRRNNVWSEATSSESVEMLLKSVGQEEMVPGETIVEEPDVFHELGSLTKQMEPISNEEGGKEDVIGSHHESPSGVLNDRPRGDCPLQGTSQTQEAKLSVHGISSELDLSAVSEKFGSFVTENLEIDRKSNENQGRVDILVEISPRGKMQEDPYMHIDNRVFENQEMVQQTSGIGVENPRKIPKDVGEGVERLHVVSGEAKIDDQNLKGTSAEIGSHTLDTPLVSSEVPIKQHASENHINMEEPSSMPLNNDDLQKAEGCSENACSSYPALEDKCEAAVLPNSTVFNQEYAGNLHEESPEVFQGDRNTIGNDIEVCNSELGVNLERGSFVPIPQGKSYSVEKEDSMLGSDYQLGLEAPVSNSEASSSPGTCDKLTGDNGDGNGTTYAGVFSNLIVACSSTEIPGEEHSIEHSKDCNAASGMHKEDSAAGDRASPFVIAGSAKPREGDVIFEKSDICSDEYVSLDSKGKAHSLNDTSDMDCETVEPPSTGKRIGSSSLVEGSEEDRIDHGSKCDTSAGDEPVLDVTLDSTNLADDNIVDGVPLPSASVASADEIINHREQQKSPSLVGVSMHLDEMQETKVDVTTGVSLSTRDMCMDGPSELGSTSGAEKGFPHDATGLLIQEAVDQSLPTVETCSAGTQSEQVSVTTDVGREDSKKLEVSPFVCDDGAEGVILDNHEDGTIQNNHKLSSSEAEGLVVSKSQVQRELVPVSLMESCCNLSNKEPENKEAIAVSGINDFEQSVPSMGVDTSKDHQDSSNSALVSKSDGNSAFEGGDCSTDPDKANCGSPTIIRSIGLSQSEQDRQVGSPLPLDNSVSLSEVVDGDASKGQSSSPNLIETDAVRDDKSFTFVVSPSAFLSESGPTKTLQSFTPIQPCKISTIVEDPTSASGVGQVYAKITPEISPISLPVADAKKSRGGSKGTSEGKKTRRASGKATGKDNAKKGSQLKEPTPARHSERREKACSVPMSPSATGQLVQLDRPHGKVDCSGAKPCGAISVLAPNLLDMSTSTPPSVLFQQPFTDLQQVQLRAQIFVYGSLIQGASPDEACMISAFGTSDGARSVWEPVWRTFVERIQGQKSHPTSDTPLPSRSGASTADQAIKQGPTPNKVISAPVGKAGSKNTPSPAINSVVPLSSPLWNTSTPYDGLQSSGIARGSPLDFHQPLTPLHPYRTPPARNLVGHSASWLSQAPYPGPWVASPQPSSFDAHARFSMTPIVESVKLTPVKESTLPITSVTKHISPSPVVQSRSPSVSSGTGSNIDMKKVTQSSFQHSTNSKSKKRKKLPISEDRSHIPLLAQSQTEPVSAPVVSSQITTSIVIPEPACTASKTNNSKFITAFSPTSSTNNSEKGHQNAEKMVAIAEETYSKVEDAKLQAEEAAALAAASVSHSQGLWSQLDKLSGLTSDDEVKIASAAIAIAAAAAVAKAAAAAAKIASNAALQAKLMADEALGSSGSGGFQSTAISLSGVSHLGTATPASTRKGGDGSNYASSVIVAAREAARRRIEAASAASKHAENLNDIVKAAELAAEAVSQAGIIVAMGNPLPLSELVKAGPEGYWKVPEVRSQQGLKLSNMNEEQSSLDRIEEGTSGSAKHTMEQLTSKTEIQVMNHVREPISTEISGETIEGHVRKADGVSGAVANSEKESRGPVSHRVSDLAKPIGVVPESEVGQRSDSLVVQDEYEKAETWNNIKEGSLVEVLRDGDNTKAAWFSANVLSLEDGKALVCYNELQSDEGSGHLTEWVELENEGNKAPHVRIAHPITILRFEGTRKRRRMARGDYAWSIGDRCDAWIQDSWREGVVMEKNPKDETSVTVRFPAEGETSLVRTWHLRPTLFWKDGEWIEWSRSREKDSASQGETPQQKRFKLGSPAVEVKEKEMSKNIESVVSRNTEESLLLPLSAKDKVFNVGKHTRDENKPDALRTMRTGLQKEGSKVIFGIPKPGKKRKFMEVSKHYVAERCGKNIETADSVKSAKYLMPQTSGSRGWKNNPKIEYKEKQAAESKSKILKSGKPQSGFGKTLPLKDRFLSSSLSVPNDGTITDIMIKGSNCVDETGTGSQNLTESRSVFNTQAASEGPILLSSLAVPSDAPSKKLSASNAKSEMVKRGRSASSSGKSAKSEVKDKVHNGNTLKSISEVAEPRRSNRRIQPTSRLLEGLQSSLIVSKIPSHDKSHKSVSKSALRGNNNG